MAPGAAGDPVARFVGAPAAALDNRSAQLGPEEKLIWAACIAVMNDALDRYVVTIGPEDLGLRGRHPAHGMTRSARVR